MGMVGMDFSWGFYIQFLLICYDYISYQCSFMDLHQISSDSSSNGSTPFLN